MTIRFYLMPLIGTGETFSRRRPAYLDTDLGGAAQCLDYGAEPLCLVRADVSGAQHTALTAHDDVLSVPTTLSNQIGGTLATVQTALDAVHVPNDWLQSTHTWAQLLRAIATIFQFAQRLHRFRAGRLFPAGVTLTTQFQDLPPAARQALQDAADDMAFDTSELTGASTLRAILKAFGDQFTGTIRMGPDTLP